MATAANTTWTCTRTAPFTLLPVNDTKNDLHFGIVIVCYELHIDMFSPPLPPLVAASSHHNITQAICISSAPNDCIFIIPLAGCAHDSAWRVCNYQTQLMPPCPWLISTLYLLMATAAAHCIVFSTCLWCALSQHRIDNTVFKIRLQSYKTPR